VVEAAEHRWWLGVEVACRRPSWVDVVRTVVAADVVDTAWHVTRGELHTVGSACDSRESNANVAEAYALDSEAPSLAVEPKGMAPLYGKETAGGESECSRASS